MWHTLKSTTLNVQQEPDVGHTADYCPQSGGQRNSIPNTVILLDLLGHVRLPFHWLWEADVPTSSTSLCSGVLTLAQNITTCRLRARASGHEMQNLFGSNRNTDAGQAAGRRLEGRAKMKMTQRQNIDTLDWSIEKVSNYLWGMLTYSTVVLKNCVKILSVACIKLLL